MGLPCPDRCRRFWWLEAAHGCEHHSLMGSTVSVWDLDADPAQLEAFEAAWKAQAEKLSWAADTIVSAANRVVGGYWDGPAAHRYDEHRRKLVGDLDDAADLAGDVARAVGECVQTLRFNQNLLDEARAKVAPRVRCVVTGVEGKVDLYPEDDDQVTLTNELVQTYEQIRARVDGKLNQQLGVVNAAIERVREWADTWSGRTLRMLNYNIQQGGGGNALFSDQGHQKEDMARLAQRLINDGVDIATVQEVFRDGAKELERQLNLLAGPGEKWEVHFGPASLKPQAEDLGLPETFGNAVIVRTDDNVSTSEVTVTPLGPGDEERSAVDVGITLD